MAEDSLNGSPDLAGILNELLSNEELTSKISEIASSSKSDTSSIDGGGINSLLSNTDLMSKLPEVISVIKPMMSGGKPSETRDMHSDRRLGLLMAMKPYLSPKRCEAIDYIAKMSRLSETLKGLL